MLQLCIIKFIENDNFTLRNKREFLKMYLYILVIVLCVFDDDTVTQSNIFYKQSSHLIISTKAITSWYYTVKEICNVSP